MLKLNIINWKFHIKNAWKKKLTPNKIDMSFIKIQNPAERRKEIERFISLRSSIQEQDRSRKLAEKNIYETNKKMFKRITDSQKETVKESVEELKKELEPLKKLNFINNPQPSLEAIEMPPSVNVASPTPSIIMARLGFSPAETEKCDIKRGPYFKDNEWYLGKKLFKFKGDNFVVDGDEYEGSPGLWKLLFDNRLGNKNFHPNKEETYTLGFTPEDYQKYKEIMIETDALRLGDTNSPKSDNGLKWSTIQKPIWAKQKHSVKKSKIPIPSPGKRPKSTSSVSGMGVSPTFLPSSPLELINRFDLSFASN